MTSPTFSPTGSLWREKIRLQSQWVILSFISVRVLSKEPYHERRGTHFFAVHEALRGRGSMSCVPRSRNSISWVSRCLLHVYQVRPDLSTSNMTSCFPQLVRNCVICIESCGYTKCSAIGRFLQSFIVL